jgi:hypothetical protein
MATPPFLNGPSGAQTPAPVTSPLGGGAPGAPPDQMQQLLKMILSGAQQKPQMAQPTPAPIPQGGANRPALVGKYTGFANLGAAIGDTVKNVIHMDKQKKLAAATSDWKDLLTSTQKYMTPDGKVDPKAYQDPAVMQVLGDPKKLKRMAKALNADWLNPKPDEYADGLKIAIQQHQKQQGAIQGLKQTMQQMVQHIRGQDQKQQQQISPQGAASIMQRAPMSGGGTSGPDVKEVNETMRTIIDANKAKEEAAYHQAQIAATADERKAALAQAKQISDQNFQLRSMQMEYEQGRQTEQARHNKAMEGIAGQRVKQSADNKANPKVSAAEQDKRDKLAGASASIGQIVQGYSGKKDTEPITASDQAILSGMFNTVTGAGLPKQARTWMQEQFASGNVMTVGEAKKMQKILGNFKVGSSAPDKPDEDINFTPDE